MDYARSNMAIIDAPSVKIEISILPDNRSSGLWLSYHGQRYKLVQAFSSHKVELAQQRWQQQIGGDRSESERYLLVREVGYYSLWVLNQSVNPVSTVRASSDDLAVQQASIWLFQELWIQWQDLLGERQLQIFSDNLLAANSQLRSQADLDRLLSLDPLSTEQLADWERADFVGFARQLGDLTQKKMGQQFGHKLTIEIVESMPDLLKVILIDALDLETQVGISHHD